MMPDRIAALDQYVEQHVQQGMQELVRLCNQPSISSQGLGMQECAALVVETPGAVGFSPLCSGAARRQALCSWRRRR